jgi:hypothetical protein
MMTYGGSPAEAHVPAESRDHILHARLIAGDQHLLASDAPAGQYEKPQGISVTLNLRDPAEGERIFRALAENGRVTMPFQSTFWAAEWQPASIRGFVSGGERPQRRCRQLRLDEAGRDHGDGKVRGRPYHSEALYREAACPEVKECMTQT